jgi:mono/diheme cytochrome c family protein
MEKMIRKPLQVALFSLCFLLLWTMFPAAAQEPVTPPTVRPDGDIGFALFQQRCANCHGPLGAGDGEMAADLPAPPIAFSAPDYRFTAVPSNLYDVISNGRLVPGMPPFGDSSSNPIAPDDRWHLVAAIFSLATPPQSIAQGETIFQATCAECHARPDDQPDLTDFSYWVDQSNQMVFTRLTVNSLAEHELDLSDQDWLAVIDYIRSQSYTLADLDLLANDVALPGLPTGRMIDAATVTGDVTNATTGQMISGGEARLRAFNMDLNEMLSLTAEVDENGRFQFDLEEVDAAWVYLANYAYDGISYSSEPMQLDPGHPYINMPVTVYDPTTDPGGILIDRIHVVVQFIENQIFVNELYVVSNMDTAVFVGVDGDPLAGTFHISLPPNAHSISFERGFSSLDSFVPADEIIQTPTGFADTLPIRPGQASLNLLVGYGLPYQPGMTVAHAVNYQVQQASIAMPQTGVTVTGDDWLPQEPRVMGSSTVLNYVNPQPAITGNLTFVLEGQPRQVTGQQGNVVAATNIYNSWEVWMGAAFLLAAVIAAAVFIYQWQIAPARTGATANPQYLLQEIAALDDAYENGELSATAYKRQRQKLKRQLLELWEK